MHTPLNESGLLWGADSLQEELKTTIEHGCARYQVRFGHPATVAYVSAESFDPTLTVANLQI